MNQSSTKIIIAAVIIMLATNFLAGCASQNVSEIGVERIQAAAEMKKSVSLALIPIESEDDLTLRLVLQNTEGKPITSVQAWLAYNPDLIRGVSMDTSNSAFSMVAPYENGFDEALGIMMLGRSNATPVSDEEIFVADLHFERLASGAIMIDAFDYKQDLEGHVSANMMLDSVPVNVLLKPESPLLILNEEE